MRLYIGVDWADQEHAVWVEDETGTRVDRRTVAATPTALADWGRWLAEQQRAGQALWAAIERPDGRVVDFLLDHGVVVYPINPRTLAAARDRFRVSGAKSDPFDAQVLAGFLRTDHGHLDPLQPSSPAAQELKLLTRDYHRQVRQQTRLLNQLTVTLKAYYPRALELLGDLKTAFARAFLRAYPTPAEAAALPGPAWQRFARAHRLGGARTAAGARLLALPQAPLPEHVVRAHARRVRVLLDQLDPVVAAVASYQAEIERFFATLPAADYARSLPVGAHGITVPSLWAELGDAPGRWRSWQHLQAHSGSVPVTDRSGKHVAVRFRHACNKHLRYLASQLAFLSLERSAWARAYYDAQRHRGHAHYAALRALGAKWLKIIFAMWTRAVPYDETYHLATMTRHQLRQSA
jgi:transposase